MGSFPSAEPLLYSSLLAVGIAWFLTWNQVFSTYRGFSVQVHKERAASVPLYLLNGLIVSVVAIIMWFIYPKGDWWWIGAGVGLGLPTIVQSRITLTKPPGSKLVSDKSGAIGSDFASSILNTISVDMSVFYNMYTDTFFQRMDGAYFAATKELDKEIKAKFPETRGLDDLYIEAQHAILRARRLNDKQRSDRQEFLKKEIASDRTEDEKKETLGLFLVELMGPAYVRNLLRSRQNSSGSVVPS